jgi:hypothetical protein
MNEPNYNYWLYLARRFSELNESVVRANLCWTQAIKGVVDDANELNKAYGKSENENKKERKQLVQKAE